MAYKGCISSLAANIAQDCEKPIVGGYTGRAVIIPVSDWERAEVVYNAGNPRKVESVVLPPDGSVQVFTIDNVFSVPFTGSTTTGNNESGRNQYVKTLAVRIPMRGADTAKDVVEPLIKNADGYVAIVEKKDRVGDGGFEIIGLQNAVKGDIASVTRDEYANGADWLMNLVTTETWAEADLVGAGGTYESAKKEFEGLLYFEPMVMRMTTSVVDQEFFELSANGVVYIDSIKNGEKVRKTLVSPNKESVAIENDENTEIVVWGAVTYLEVTEDANTGLTSLDVSKNIALNHLSCNSNAGLTSLDVSKNTSLTELNCGNCTGLTSLDVSKNTALTYLECGNTGLTSLDVSKNAALTILGCHLMDLTSLDVSKNTALTLLSCDDCQNLTMMNIKNTAELTDGIILDQSMANLTTLQVAGTSAWAYEQVETWLTDSAPNDGKIYVDENTPQGVITAAEAKDWEVIYQA